MVTEDGTLPRCAEMLLCSDKSINLWWNVCVVGFVETDLVRLVASVAFNLATIDVIASADKHGIILATTGACTATWGTVSIFRQAAQAGVFIAIAWGVGEIRRREIIIGGAGDIIVASGGGCWREGVRRESSKEEEYVPLP